MKIVFLELVIILTHLCTSVLAAPSFDCQKSSTSIEKTICQHSGISLADKVMDYVYKIAVNVSPNSDHIKASQIEWLETRPENKEALEKAYEKRIQALLADQYCLQAVIANFFKENQSQIQNWVVTGDGPYDVKMDDAHSAIFSCIMDAYLMQAGNQATVAPEHFADRSSSLLYKLSNDKYLFFYLDSMYAYNANFSAWIINQKQTAFKAIRLMIPKYDRKYKRITLEESIPGWVWFNRVENIIHTLHKGAGNGRWAMKRNLILREDKFFLLEQEATLDNYNDKFELTGSVNDWIVEYKSP